MKLHELSEHIDEIMSAIADQEKQVQTAEQTLEEDKNETTSADYAENEKIDALAELAELSVNEPKMQDDNIGENTTEQDETDLAPSSKFKSVEELEKAYNALEKEFTRRCQRLAKLEKACQKTEEKGEWKVQVDKFFTETPDAKKYARDIATEIAKDTSLRSRSNPLEVALNRVLLSKKTPSDLAKDEDFLQEYILSSDFVKKAVIHGYMKDLQAGKPPVLMTKLGQNTVAPQSKPTTIEEAGRMFRQHNK